VHRKCQKLYTPRAFARLLDYLATRRWNVERGTGHRASADPRAVLLSAAEDRKRDGRQPM